MSNNSTTNTTPSSSSSAAPSSFRGFADFAKHTDFATSSGSTTAAVLLAARRRQASTSTSATATTTATAASPSSGTTTTPQQHQQPQQQQPQFRPSPIYAGNDARLSLLFRTIGQKRNATTKVRAIEELIHEVYPTRNSSSTTTTTNITFSRPEKIAALSHLLYLHETKLGYDNNPSVRALSYMALISARSHVPKAWSALFLGINNNNNGVGGGGDSVGGGGSGAVAVAIVSIGMAWGAMRGDPATEVSKNATLFMEELIRAEKEEEEEEKDVNNVERTVDDATKEDKSKFLLLPGRKIQVAIYQYCNMVLSCKRPSSLQDCIINFNTALASSVSSMLFPSSSGVVAGSPNTSATAGAGNSGAKGKKGKNNSTGVSSNDASATSTATNSSAEMEKEEMTERYERVIISVLFGLGWLLECSSQEQEESDERSKKDTCCYHHASTEFFPDAVSSIVRLLSSSRGSFRKGTYMLLGQICQFAPSLLLLLSTTTTTTTPSSSLSMASLIPSLLSSEKDPSNFVSLLEMILSYLAAAQGGKLDANIDAAFRPLDNDNDASSCQKDNVGTTTTTMLIDPILFTTALSKALRRGCYGAPAGLWGPIILPFVASLPAHPQSGVGSGSNEEVKGRIEVDEERKDPQVPQSPSPLQLTIVSSLWEGRKSAPGVTDTIAIVSAVAECTTYLLLRRNHRPLNFTAQSWRLCGELFLNTLSYYLIEAPDKTEAYGPVASAVDGLCSTLSRDLNKLDVSSLSSSLPTSSTMLGWDDSKNSCVGISTVKSWFWGHDGIERLLVLEEGRTSQELIIVYRKWDLLLKSLLSLNDGKQSSASQLVPACKKLFHSIANKNMPCTDDEGRLLLTILQFGQVDTIFSSNTSDETVDEDGVKTFASIERFCVNDVLRWILEHASTSASAIKIDFEIFQLCMYSIPSVIRQKQICETILRELIKSGCDYTALAIGLETLASSEASSNFVQCQVLDTFAIDTSKSLMNNFRLSHDILHQQNELGVWENPSTRGGDVSRFLKSCVGNSSDALIVSESVLRRWIDLCCERDDESATKWENKLLLEDESGNNVLLRTLLDLSSRNKIVVSQMDTIKLICVSWYEGGKTWNSYAVKRLFLDDELRDELISIAENSLHDNFCSPPPTEEKLWDLVCHSWAKRAARLIGIHPAAGLDSIGLGSTTLWEHAALVEENDSEFLFLCLMYLLDSIGSYESRRNILMRDMGMFVHIQAAIAKWDIHSESFHQRTERSRQLMDFLGGSDNISSSFLEDSCIHTIDLLIRYINDDIAAKKIMLMRGLTSLCYLVSVLFPSTKQKDPRCRGGINPVEVKEGDTVWYQRGERGESVKATIVKVHTDDFPNFYFTIKEEDSERERQTVAGRLRWTNEDLIENLTENDTAQSDRVGQYIVDKIVNPFFTRCDDDKEYDEAITTREFAAECINIVISQCGIVSQGIGSVRYEIFQAAQSIVEELCTSLSSAGNGPCLEKSQILLRNLSLAMGYGCYTIPAQNNISLLKLDASNSIMLLLQLYENEPWLDAQREAPSNTFHSGVLMWLAVATDTIMEGELLGRIAEVVFSCSDFVLSGGSCNLVTDYIPVMKAMSSLQCATDRCGDCYSTNDEHESSVLSKLTQAFIRLATHHGQWIQTFTLLLQQKCNRSRSTLLPAATAFSNELCDCLFDPKKRWCAFQLLNILAKESRPSQCGDDSTLPTDINQHLSEWKRLLDEEEAMDLEGDVSIAAAWLPERIMSLLLNFGNKSASKNYDHDMQVVSIGNLLTWVVSLDILEVAGSVDMRNRAHISSFIQKTNALGFIMNLTLQEADLNSRGVNIFNCVELDLEGSFYLHKIATLALFRSVESLPTMVKTWYNDDCPRFLQQKLSVFVENVVAPTTLQRELTRIKDATSFGEMTVNGSCVSREVVATYQQDECQLSVMIRMPPTFPLRNVEVDCKKTMGIPESRWRRWALQIMLMLNNQDGSILDALLLWKQNVDKEFDGVEPCPVCYSVLCIKTHQMPNLECKTCHNRFHTTCLMKWFQSSGKSSCVLCQQPWSGSKV